MAGMSDEPSVRGWLPPRAPGAQPPPRFEPAAEEPPPAASGWQPPVARDPEPTAPTRPAESSLARPQQARASGLAITSIVLGVIGIAFLLLSVGTSFLLSLPCSGAAWACGLRARQRAEAGPGGGARGPAQTGVVLGMVGVGLGIVAAIVWIVLLSAGVSIDDLRDSLQRRLEEERR
jgi:hypothetical protein